MNEIPAAWNVRIACKMKAAVDRHILFLIYYYIYYLFHIIWLYERFATHIQCRETWDISSHITFLGYLLSLLNSIHIKRFLHAGLILSELLFLSPSLFPSLFLIHPETRLQVNLASCASLQKSPIGQHHNVQWLYTAE